MKNICEKHYFIYILKDPRIDHKLTGYIGFTNNPKHRLSSHYANCNLKSNTPKNTWINNLKSKELMPIMEILFETDEFSWQQDEIETISFYRILGWNLKNTAIGGQGCHGRMLSEEHKQKIRMSSLGKKMSAESILKMSLSKIGKPSSKKGISTSRPGPMNGKHQSEEARHKMSLSKKGKHLSPFTEFKKRQIPWNKKVTYEKI